MISGDICCIKVLVNSSKTRNCTSPTDSCNFLSLKNLLVIINNKLHSKSLPIHCEVKREAVKRVLKEKNIKKMAEKKSKMGTLIYH